MCIISACLGTQIFRDFYEYKLRLKQNSALSTFVEKLSFTVRWLGGLEESTCDFEDFE